MTIRKTQTNLALLSSLHPSPRFINIHGKINPGKKESTAVRNEDKTIQQQLYLGKRLLGLGKGTF